MSDLEGTMATIPESRRDLVEAPLVASLSTVGSDGTPQVTAIWFVADGDTVKASLATARQKYRNVVARPRATLFIIDPNNPFRTLEIRDGAGRRGPRPKAFRTGFS